MLIHSRLNANLAERSSLSLVRVELLQQRRGYALDHLYLSGGKVIRPGAGVGLAVEFDFTPLLLGHVLPGVSRTASARLFSSTGEPRMFRRWWIELPFLWAANAEATTYSAP
jgi:hypothetical protein